MKGKEGMADFANVAMTATAPTHGRPAPYPITLPPYRSLPTGALTRPISPKIARTAAQGPPRRRSARAARLPRCSWKILTALARTLPCLPALRSRATRPLTRRLSRIWLFNRLKNFNLLQEFETYGGSNFIRFFSPLSSDGQKVTNEESRKGCEYGEEYDDERARIIISLFSFDCLGTSILPYRQADI